MISHSAGTGRDAASFACPESGCLIFPYDTQADIDEHVASGEHVFAGSWRQREPGRWVKDGGVWFVEAPGSKVHDVATVRKADGTVVKARLTGRHRGDLFTAVPA